MSCEYSLRCVAAILKFTSSILPWISWVQPKSYQKYHQSTLAGIIYLFRFVLIVIPNFVEIVHRGADSYKCTVFGVLPCVITRFSKHSAEGLIILRF
ncbi:hypothetical protein EDD15DRAFT_140077 [Pisolithus albus]|nr:hypothetical protein EDD15DRAFT_140077 [Pisolithus albus]